MSETQTTRVNGSMLSSYQGRNVALIGLAKDIDNNGTCFTLTTCDDQDVRVVMQEPLNEYVAGLTEVHGQVDKNCTIQCNSYITFPQDVSDAFNMPLYNKTVELIARAPQHYQQGMQRP